MSHPHGLSEWTADVSTHLPQLSRTQARVLALLTYGMVLSRSCALSAVSVAVSLALDQNANTVRQRLREFCYDAKDKRGAFREEVDVSGCFAALLSWVLSKWPSPRLALALDATTLSERFVVLAVSVVYNGCAIPVAWTVLPPKEKHAWKGDWLRLLGRLKGAVPDGVTVVVMADRGLFASWLFRGITDLGWHPLLRINAQGTFRQKHRARFLPLSRYAPVPGTCWAGEGTAFSTPGLGLKCTLLARYDEGHEGPWLLLTDLCPWQGEACWYGMRSWIEQGFKAVKSGGFGWQHTRMRDPKRCERLWLCVAVATLWVLALGTQGETAVDGLVLPHDSVSRKRRATALRLHGLFRLGWAYFIACVLCRRRLPKGRFRPDPWHRSPLTTNHQPITYP